jgi:hypothetical protein
LGFKKKGFKPSRFKSYGKGSKMSFLAERKKNLEEDLFGKYHKVGNFGIFRFLTYSYVSSKKNKNIEPMVEKGICFWYTETSKFFPIYIPSSRKKFVRRDVVFEEDRAL